MVAVVKTVLRLAWACFLFVRNEREEELFLAPINKTTYSENMQMMGVSDTYEVSDPCITTQHEFGTNSARTQHELSTNFSLLH